MCTVFDVYITHVTGRIPTTHTGSLPRPDDVGALLAAVSAGERVDTEQMRKTVSAAVVEAVSKQIAAGIDIVGDGEMGAVSFMDTASRLTGFGGPMSPYFPSDMAGLQAGFAEAFIALGDRILASNDSPDIAYRPARATETCERLSGALAGLHAVPGAFVAAPAPATLARLGSSVLERRELLARLADAMAQEYRIIVDHDFDLQLDDPESAMGKHVDFADLTVAQFREVVRENIAAINRALEGIPPERVRLHACYGNYPGPHHHDIPLADVIDLLYEANVGAIVVPLANPQHRHEWRVFEQHPLPDDKILIAGMVDPLSPVVEHPRTVADSLVRLAEVVGRDRIVAGTDCGMATFAAVPEAAAQVAYLKLASLADGAAIASTQLW
jgi:5-methyltetrahydropteroyltriglutamate--homocysteine methyltransferase